MQSLAVVGPCDMNTCFDAANALAEADEEGDVRVEKALHFADPGVVQCVHCQAYLMAEGEVMLCECGAFIHVPTGNRMTHEQVWSINHRPQYKLDFAPCALSREEV